MSNKNCSENKQKNKLSSRLIRNADKASMVIRIQGACGCVLNISFTQSFEAWNGIILSKELPVKVL